MKYSTLLLSLSLSSVAMQVSAIELPSALNEQLKTTKTTTTDSSVQSNALISYAAEKLEMSEKTITGGLGSLFKVAKDNLSKDNFSMLTKAIPDINSYIAQAPNDSSSSFTSLLSGSETGKQAASLNYLDSAFKKLGIPKESLPAMVNTVSGYLDSNGYGEAAGMLKKGLSFL